MDGRQAGRMPTSTHPYVRWLPDKTTDELKDLMTLRLTSLRRNGYGPISPRDLTQLATMLGDPDNVLPDVRRMATPYLHLLRVMADRGGSIPEADAVDVLRGAPEDVATMVGAAVACGYVGRADGWLHLCPGLDESIRRTTSAPPPDGVSIDGPRRRCGPSIREPSTMQPPRPCVGSSYDCWLSGSTSRANGCPRPPGARWADGRSAASPASRAPPPTRSVWRCAPASRWA